MSKIDPTPFYAYGSDRAGVETVMRFHAVKRWHMIDTTRNQTLAEHSANVALLAYYIAAHSPEMFFGSSTSVCTIALLHDIDEVFTGDIPSHTKKFLSGLNDLENTTTPACFKVSGLPERVKSLIKLCDLADGIRFIRLHGVDITARHAREGLERQLATNFEKANSLWSEVPHVYSYVEDIITFYAYELS